MPGKATVPSHHTLVNHGFIAGYRESGAESTCELSKHLQAPGCPCDDFASCATSAGPRWPPRDLGRVNISPRGLGDSVLIPSMPPLASVFLQREPALPASGLHLQPGLTKGLRRRRWGCSQYPARARHPAGPLAKRHPPSWLVAEQISRQDAGKSFLLRRRARMGASLPAELRQPVAQLPSLHTCSARLR